MKTTRFLSLLCVSLAMFALPAAAQAAGQSTPATMGLCDGLADATPGLQGLCVAMCEAQACEAEISADGTVDFGASCGPSAPQLLENYNKLANFDNQAGPVDPSMPCVKVACPCWTEAELEDIGGLGADVCYDGGTYIDFRSKATDKGVREYALASSYSECASNEAGFSEDRFVDRLSADAHGACLKTVRAEASSRGLTCY